MSEFGFSPSPSLRTPTRSIVKPLEVGSITPSAIQELSSQIDSLIQRGRKLRELKSTMSSKSEPRTLNETRISALDPNSVPLILERECGPLEDMLAVVNASDPLFMDDASQLSETSHSRTFQVPAMPFKSALECLSGTGEAVCVYSVDSTRLSVPNATIRMRTVGETSNREVKSTTTSEVAVEVWRNSELVGLGRKVGRIQSIPSKLDVEITDVWQGIVLGHVILKIESPPSIVSLPPASETIVLETSSDIGRSSVQPHNTYKESLEDFLIHRSRPTSADRPPQAAPTSRAVASDLTARRLLSSPVMKKSVESFVSFISQDEEFDLSDDECPSATSEVAETFSRIQRETMSQIKSELESVADAKTLLFQKISELDAITYRLVNPSPVDTTDVEQRVSAIALCEEPLPGWNYEEVPKLKMDDFKAPPDFSHLFSYIPTEPVSRPVSPRKEGVQRSAMRMTRRVRRVTTRKPKKPTTEELEDFGERNEKLFELEPVMLSSRSVSQLIETPVGNLSLVSSSLVDIFPTDVTRSTVNAHLHGSEKQTPKISEKRHESISRARRTIATLRQSFLKDADKICAAIAPQEGIDEGGYC